MNRHERALRANDQPANRIMSKVRDNRYASAAALTTFATFGIGLALLIPGSWRRPADTAEKAAGGSHREMSPPTSSYFEPAPRSIYGSHRSFEEFSAAGGGMVKKSGAYLFGSAVLLASLYLLGRKNGRLQLSGNRP